MMEIHTFIMAVHGIILQNQEKTVLREFFFGLALMIVSLKILLTVGLITILMMEFLIFTVMEHGKLFQKMAMELYGKAYCRNILNHQK